MSRQLTQEDEDFIAAAEQRIAERLAQVEQAQGQGRLKDVIRDVRPVSEQLADAEDPSA